MKEKYVGICPVCKKEVNYEKRRAYIQVEEKGTVVVLKQWTAQCKNCNGFFFPDEIRQENTRIIEEWRKKVN